MNKMSMGQIELVQVVVLLVIISCIPKTTEVSPSEIKNLLATEIRKFSLKDFRGDPELLQNVEPLNALTKYKDAIKNVIFKTTTNDSGKDVIVVSADEQRRNTFLVLRKSEKKDTYYASYAYIRDATSQDVHSITIGDTQKCIEWDTWENRRSQENSEWVDCRASIIVSCAYNETLVGEPVKNLFVKKLTTTTENIEPIPLKSEEGFSTDYNSEFFDDIDDSNKPNKAMSRGFGFLGFGGSASVSVDINIDINFNKKSTRARKPPPPNNMNVNIQFYMLINVIVRTSKGNKAEREFVPCSDDCKGGKYRKICRGKECHMKQEVETNNENTIIYVSRWASVKSESENDDYKSEKIQHFRPGKIYWRDCSERKKCVMVESDARDNLENLKLYTVVKKDEPIESDDTYIVESVNEFKQLSPKDISDLYKNVCTRARNGGDECKMERLLTWIDDDEIMTNKEKNEYKLYVLVAKTEVKTDSSGRKINEKSTKYEPTKIIVKSLFTNICKNEICSMESVIEEDDYPTYKINPVDRKTKLPNGKYIKNFLRFEAVSPTTPGDLYTKSCEEGKQCTMKQFHGSSTDYVKFYKIILTIDVNTTKTITKKKIKTTSGNKKYVPVKLYKTVCVKSKCNKELVTNPADISSGGDIFEEVLESGTDVAKLVQLPVLAWSDIHYEICSKECGMIPASEVNSQEAPKYFRLVKSEREVPSGSRGYKTVLDSEFVPTKLFKKICDGSSPNCSMEFIPKFDIGVQEECKKNNITPYFLAFTSGGAAGGLSMVANFIELDPMTQGNLYEKDCSDDSTCAMKHVDNLQEHFVYQKMVATLNEGQESSMMISFEPIQLYKKTYGKGKTVIMEPALVTSVDLKNQVSLYTLNPNKVGEVTAGAIATVGGKAGGSLVGYMALDTDAIDQLYRKHCEDGKCVMKPLKEDEPNVFYELVSATKGTSQAEEFKLILLFNRVCQIKNKTKVCQMEPFSSPSTGKSKTPIPLYFREIAVSKADTIAEKPGGNIIRKFSPLTKEQNDRIYQKVCQDGSEKCFMKSLYDAGLLQLIIGSPDVEAGPGVASAGGTGYADVKNYVPIQIYKSECDKNGTNCEMFILSPTEGNPNDFDLFLLDKSLTVKSDSNPKLARVKKTFKRFPQEMESTIFKRVCTGEGCAMKHFFEDPVEFVILEKSIKTTEPDVTKEVVVGAEKQIMTPLQVYKKICKGTPEKCRMLLFTGKDDPRALELFIGVMVNNTDLKPVRNYDAILTDTLSKLFKKICEGKKCKLIRLIPEDENTIYKKNLEKGGDFEMAFVYQKVCPNSKPEDCEMIPITLQDNPRKVNMFEMVSEKVIKTSANGKQDFGIVETYNPILPETHDGVYFRKVCNPTLNTCVLKELYDDKNLVYQQLTIMHPETEAQLDTHYRLIHLYKKTCGENERQCEMEYTTPEDNLKQEHLFELKVKRVNKTVNGKKVTERHILVKEYDPIPNDLEFSLYRKLCKNIDCAYMPIFEDENSIYKLIKKETRSNTLFKKDITEQKLSEYVLIQLYENNCQVNDNSKCKMELITADKFIPDKTFELIVTNRTVDAPGGGKKEEVFKKFIRFNLKQYFRLYKKNCEGNTCKMVPLHENKVFKLNVIKTETKILDGTRKLETVKKFVPANLFTKNCTRGANAVIKSCVMAPLEDLENVTLDNLFEATVSNLTGKNSALYDPIIPTDVKKLFKKSCPAGGKCTMVPLIVPDVFIGRIYKVVKQDEAGHDKSETDLDLVPVHLFQKTCDPKKTEKKCSMKMFRASDPSDDEGHFHLYNLTIEKNFSKIDNGNPIVSAIRKYAPITSATEDLLYKKVCENGHCFAKPVFDSTFYYWKNTTRLRNNTATGQFEQIATEELVPLKLVIEKCAGGGCSLRQFTADEEDITPPIKVLIQDKRSTKKILPNGREVDDTVINNKEFTAAIREHTNLKICPQDKPCYMKPFGETKLGQALAKLSLKSQERISQYEFMTSVPMTQAPDIVTELVITLQPATPPMPNIPDEITEPSIFEEIATPSAEIRIIQEVTEGVASTIEAEIEATTFPSTIAEDITEIVTMPPEIEMEEKPKEKPKIPSIKVRLNKITKPSQETTTLATTTEMDESIRDPNYSALKSVIKEGVNDGTILGEMSERLTVPPNINEILLTTQLPFKIVTENPVFEGELEIPPETHPPMSETTSYQTTPIESTTVSVILVRTTPAEPEDSLLRTTEQHRVELPSVNTSSRITVPTKEPIVDVVTFEPPEGSIQETTTIATTTASSKETSEMPPGGQQITGIPLDTTGLHELVAGGYAKLGITIAPTSIVPEVTTIVIDTHDLGIGELDNRIDMTGLPDESDEYDDIDDYEKIKVDYTNGPTTTILKNLVPNCPVNVVFETPDKKRLIFKLKDPPTPNIVNKVTALTFETVNPRIMTFQLPEIQNPDNHLRWLQVAYTSPTKERFIFELPGFPDEKVPIDGHNFTLTTSQGTAVLKIPHPSVTAPLDVFFGIKTISVNRSLTNFNYVRSKIDLTNFDYNQPLRVIIDDIPDSDKKRYTIIFKTPDDIHVTMKGKKEPKSPVVIQKISFETCRNKNVSTRLPLFEVHRIPLDDKWLELSYTNKDALQEIKFPGVIKYRMNKAKRNGTRPNFKTPKGVVIFELPEDDLTNTKIHLLLVNGEKYCYEIPALLFNYLEKPPPLELKPLTKPELPLSFLCEEGKKVVFITHPPLNIQDPFNVTQYDFDTEEETPTSVPLTGTPISEKDGQTLELIYKSPTKGLETSFNFPVIQYNGEAELNIKASEGKIAMTLPNPEQNIKLMLKFNEKGGQEHNCTVTGFKVKSPILTEPAELDEPPYTEVIIETPDSKLVSFLTGDKDYMPKFRIYELKLQTAGIPDYVIKFPAKDSPKNVKYLELEYKPPRQDEVLFQIPGLPFDPEKMQPCKQIEIDSAKGTLILDFPCLDDKTRDNIRISYISKPNMTTYLYDTPFLNLPGLKPSANRKKMVRHRAGITMTTLSERVVTIETEGDAAVNEGDEPLIGTGLHFEVTPERNVTVKFPVNKKKNKKSMDVQFVQEGQNPVTIKLVGIPYIDPNFGASKYKLKTDQGVVVFDIPSPADETRSGIIFDLLLLNEDKIPYEVNGLILKGRIEMLKSTKSAGEHKHLMKQQNIFTDLGGKHVGMLTIGVPGSGNPYRMLEATFEIPGGSSVPITLAQFPPVGSTSPKWVQIRYASEDGTDLYFEIPGIPNELIEETDMKTRIVSFESNTKEESLKLVVPGPYSPKTDFEGLRFILTAKAGKKIKYDLRGFTYDLSIIKAPPDQAGRGFGSTSSADGLPAEGTSINLFYHPGWKIQYQNVTPNVTLEHEEDIFYGLGNCPYKRVTVSELRKAKSHRNIVDFYMTVLRTECLIDKRNYILSMIDSKQLEVSGKYLRVPVKSKFLSKPKLNFEEAQKLSSAFEMEVVTRIFIDETTNPNKSPTDPSGLPISRSANFLTNLALNFISKSRSSCRQHFIRLSRHLLTTLKTGYMKLVQDKIAIENCSECPEDKKINYNDRLQLMALTQFTIHGLAPVELGTMEVSQAFEHFFKINLDAIKSRIN